MWLYRRNKVTIADIVGRPVQQQRYRRTHGESSCDLRTGSSSAVATVTPTVQQPTVEVHHC